jgi:hypothetical protein
MLVGMAPMSHEREQVAGPTQFGELPAASSGIGVWAYMAVTRGPVAGTEVSLALLIGLGLGLGAWTLLMRIRFTDTAIAMTIG